MTVVEPAGGTPGIVDRVKNILLQPASEWDRIKPEQASLGGLLMGYVLPLAAISAICSVIAMSMLGAILAGVLGGWGALGIVGALVGGVFQILSAFLGVILLGFITNALAPTFGSTPDQNQAFKLAAYSMTSALLGGVFILVPILGALLILAAAIYSLVIFYIGLPRMMNTPADKRVPYFVVILLVGLVVGAILNALIMFTVMPAVMMLARPAISIQSNRGSDDVNIRLPGGVTINSGEAEQAAKQMEQALSGVQVEGGGKAIDVARLSALLPASLPGGFTRTETSSGSGGIGGFNVGNAEAIYTRGDSRLTLTITDMGAAGAFAGLAAAANVQSSRQTATGYERTQTVNGRMVTEEVDTSARTAHYQVMSNNRVMIAAQGSNVTIEEAQGAVNSVLGPAEALARAN